MVTTQKNFRLTERGQAMLKALQFILDGSREKVTIEHALEGTIGMKLSRRLLDDKSETEGDRAKNAVMLAALNHGADDDEDKRLYRIYDGALQYFDDDAEEWVDWIEYWLGQSIVQDDE